MSPVVVAVAALALLAGAALTAVRIARGPSAVDRMVALDALLATTVAGIGVHAVATRTTATLPILLVLALCAFVGAVSVARFLDRGEQ